MSEAHADIADDNAFFIEGNAGLLAQNKILYAEQIADCRGRFRPQMIDSVPVIAVFAGEFFCVAGEARRRDDRRANRTRKAVRK